MELLKKWLVLTIVFICFVTPLEVYGEVQNEDEKNLLLALIEPHISEAVEEYYGRPKQYDLFDAKIVELNNTNCQFCFEVKVQVTTFEGPHNPPYGLETITLTISNGKVVITDYEHEEKEA